VSTERLLRTSDVSFGNERDVFSVPATELGGNEYRLFNSTLWAIA